MLMLMESSLVFACLQLSFNSHSEVVETLQDPKTPQIQVMVLGVFHFAQVEPPDEMMRPTRQEQIVEVLERLEEYAPDKIFVERQPEFEYQNRVQERYQAYVEKPTKLGANEIYQLGFRLGRRLGHERLYLSDHPGRYGSLYGRTRTYAESHDQTKILDGDAVATTLGLYRTQDEDKIFENSTVLEYLARLNSDEYQKADHAYYLTVFPRVGDTELPTTREEADAKDYENEYFVGAALVADWYRRNIMIYTKILNQLDFKEERILVIFGAGHSSTLKHFFQSHPFFKVEDMKEWLES